MPARTDPARQTEYYQQVVERVGAVPGVTSVGAVSQLPLAGGNSSRSYNILGSSQSYESDLRVSTPEYFRTMGIPLLQGRSFNGRYTAASP